MAQHTLHHVITWLTINDRYRVSTDTGTTFTTLPLPALLHNLHSAVLLWIPHLHLPLDQHLRIDVRVLPPAVFDTDCFGYAFADLKSAPVSWEKHRMERRSRRLGKGHDILFQTPLELFLPFPLFEYLTPFPFFVQPFFSFPLVPCYFLNL